MPSVYDPHGLVLSPLSWTSIIYASLSLLMGSPLTILFCSTSPYSIVLGIPASSLSLLLSEHNTPSSYPVCSTSLPQCVTKSSNATLSADAFTTSMPSTLARPMDSAAIWYKRRPFLWAMPAVRTVTIALDTSTVLSTHTRLLGASATCTHRSNCVEHTSCGIATTHTEIAITDLTTA